MSLSLLNHGFIITSEGLPLAQPQATAEWLRRPQAGCSSLLKRSQEREKEFFIKNLLVRIHLIMEMILVDRPCAMGG